MDTSELSFEYCALRFLIQWERRERLLHEQISANPTLQQIRTGLRYFQVARTFAGLASDQAAQAVVDALREVDADSTLAPEAKVTALASRFKERFNHFNVSAASKLFWLKHKLPYIIYDSRAVNALRNFGCPVERSNYAQYCRYWREQYGQRQEAIKKAASRLHEVRAFLPSWHDSDEELRTLAEQPWFLERVFDIYLWEMGGEG